jgi:hypothetical protein
MGRHTIQRRRSTQPAAPLLTPAPPAPTLEQSGDNVTQRANGADDTSGRNHLYNSEDGGLTWLQIRDEPWQALRDWGPLDDFAGVMIRATELGNGSTYVGESPPSNVMDLR